jgi:hypothetical protein
LYAFSNAMPAPDQWWSGLLTWRGLEI